MYRAFLVSITTETSSVTIQNLENNHKNFKQKILFDKDNFSRELDGLLKFNPKNLDKKTKLILKYLIRHGLNFKHFTYLNYSTIADSCGLTYNQVKYKLRVLMKIGVITRIFQRKRFNTTSRYKLNAFIVGLFDDEKYQENKCLSHAKPTNKEGEREIYAKVIAAEEQQNFQLKLLANWRTIPREILNILSSNRKEKRSGKLLKREVDKFYRRVAINCCRLKMEIVDPKRVRRQLYYLINKLRIKLSDIDHVFKYVENNRFLNTHFKPDPEYVVAEKFFIKVKKGVYEPRIEPMDMEPIGRPSKPIPIAGQVVEYVRAGKSKIKQLISFLKEKNYYQFIGDKIKNIENLYRMGEKELLKTLHE